MERICWRLYQQPFSSHLTAHFYKFNDLSPEDEFDLKSVYSWGMTVSRSNTISAAVAMACLWVSTAHAGTWGSGKWGQMYWGTNPESAPTVAPSVNAQGDCTDITFNLTNLLTGQQLGWSAITHFEVTCGDLPTVILPADNPRLTNLEPGTDYTCSIVALNEVNGATGRSPTGTFTATTDSLGGLPIWLLYQATQ